METTQGKQQVLSDNFKLWCKKLSGLSDEQFKRGMERVEYNVREAAKLADDIWPPSYAAFLGYCEKPHGENSHKYFRRDRAITDQTMLNRRKRTALTELDRMKSMFPSE